jgi:hypothetical protein
MSLAGCRPPSLTWRLSAAGLVAAALAGCGSGADLTAAPPTDEGIHSVIQEDYSGASLVAVLAAPDARALYVTARLAAAGPSVYGVADPGGSAPPPIYTPYRLEEVKAVVGTVPPTISSVLVWGGRIGVNDLTAPGYAGFEVGNSFLLELLPSQAPALAKFELGLALPINQGRLFVPTQQLSLGGYSGPRSAATLPVRGRGVASAPAISEPGFWISTKALASSVSKLAPGRRIRLPE